ncbi:PREDICTED: minor histocompatibility antigen H13-like [Amphimedon queenslandica]|uniref:Uncharacterized protein n=1 Tax=Amphimedon queenslandica TaxID=400682 RepID=A0A1X7VB42_AMPQE|nr:PREDICTED: minor histocompatibility antigen H13-like [Amphimedon queenslandica]|eukprot:XP_003385037.1 PREDICTED: minor histocompatibility antigen H13-like [Amphimedon queenslandica]
MADTESIVYNETENNESLASNVSGREAASREGLATAYIFLFAMALVPIFIGSLRSVVYHYNLKKKGEQAEERIRMREAAMFPIYASVALFSLYMIFKYLPKDLVNMVLNMIFFSVGVTAVTRASSVLVDYLLSLVNVLNLSTYILQFQKKGKDKLLNIFKFEFTVIDVGLCVLAALLVAWHFLTKNWVLNNIMGVAFCFNAIELISLESIPVGCTLLGGLFLYDIFWVFGTDVMVTVAKSFDAPIKLMVPLDLPENGMDASNFGMLGLGDIVIPGLFIALLCRFDFNHHPSKFRGYFYTSFIAYIIGLGTTIAIMHIFKAAQPALLYLVPTCVGLPLVLALIRGELGPLFAYEDYPSKKTPTDSTAGDGVNGSDETIHNDPNQDDGAAAKKE